MARLGGPIPNVDDWKEYQNYPSLTVQDVIRRELDGVNYEQFYPEVSLENIKIILEAINDSLDPTDPELLRELKTLVENGDEDQLRLKIQQIRLFDPRHKKIEDDGGTHRFFINRHKMESG